MGFDAADLGTALLGLSDEGWQHTAERAIADSEEIGLKFEICPLPFLGGGGVKSPEYMAEFAQDDTLRPL